MRLIDADDLIIMEFGGIKFVPKEFIDNAPTIEPERKPNLQPTCNQLATDCISRSAALDVIRSIRVIAGSYDSEMLLIDKAEAQTELMMMPSAQPEIIRCKDCKKWHTNCLAVCEKHGCDVVSDYTKPDDYCSWAERRTDG